MKTSKNYLLFLFAFLGVLLSCDKSDEETITQEAALRGGQHANPGETRSVPFKAKFYTKRNYDVVLGTCDEAPFLEYNYQVGEGTATHLGKFTTEIYFCGNGFEYKNGVGVFVSANGDELHYLIPSPGEIGHIMPLPIPDPLYEFYFQDPFTIVGGTGRFEGASGSGYTESYVDLFVDGDPTQFIPEHQTDHVFTGTLILPVN